jgi:hypothetical protein
VSDVILGLDCSQNGSILPTRSSIFNEKSSQYQLPALPISLELVIRRIKVCTLSLNRLWDWQRSICLLKPTTTRHYALHTALLTRTLYRPRSLLCERTHGGSPQILLDKTKRIQKQTTKAYVVSSHVNIPIQRQNSRVPILTVANMPRSTCFFISMLVVMDHPMKCLLFSLLIQIIPREADFRIRETLDLVGPSPHPSVFLCYSHKKWQGSERACGCVSSRG